MAFDRIFHNPIQFLVEKNIELRKNDEDSGL